MSFKDHLYKHLVLPQEKGNIMKDLKHEHEFIYSHYEQCWNNLNMGKRDMYGQYELYCFQNKLLNMTRAHVPPSYPTKVGPQDDLTQQILGLLP